MSKQQLDVLHPKELADEHGVEVLVDFDPLITWSGTGYEAETRVRIIQVKGHIFADFREFRSVKNPDTGKMEGGYTKRGLRFKTSDLDRLQRIIPRMMEKMKELLQQKHANAVAK